MPTIKLLSGSFRSGDKRYTPKSESFQVTEKIAKLLHCSVVPASKPASPPPPAGDLTALRVQAMAMGIEVKPQWSAQKLQYEIAAHGG